MVEVLCDIGAAHQVTGAQVALAWLLSRPAVTSVVLGARTEAQLADNLGAAALDLSTAEHERLETISRPLLITLIGTSSCGPESDWGGRTWP